MRFILFFDLPMESSRERRAYSQFRKFLIKEGFIMLQKSVYSKLALNLTAVELLKKKINKKLPQKGLVQVLVITERQFSGIETVLGVNLSTHEGSTDRLLVI